MSRLAIAVLLGGCGRIGFAGGADARDASAVVPDARGAGADAAVAIDAAMLAAGDCTTIPSLAAAPVIDGVLDPGLAMTAVVPIWVGQGALPAGLAARFAAAWRPDGLYFFVDVTDPDRWPAASAEDAFCGDAAEVYVDADGASPAAPLYDSPGANQFIIGAPPTASGIVARGEIWRDRAKVGAWTSSAFIAAPTPTGYAIEAEIVAADLGLGSWAPVGHVGFDLAVDVSTSDGSPGVNCNTAGTRIGQYFLRITAPAGSCLDGGPYCDVRAFCTPQLR